MHGRLRSAAELAMLRPRAPTVRRSGQGNIMTQKPSSLSPDQESLRDVALTQLQDVLTTLEKLQAITSEQSDREAVQDARGDVNAAAGLLRDWYGTEPELTDDGSET